MERREQEQRQLHKAGRRRVILTYSLDREIRDRTLCAPLAERVALLLREALEFYGLPESRGDAGFYFPALDPAKGGFGRK